MKHSIVASLSMICLSLATATAVRAQTKPVSGLKTTIAKVTPFELVSLAYQGNYRAEGIPGYGHFLYSYYTKSISPQDLVKAAIAANDLPPETLTDRGYLHAIEFQLLSPAE